MTKLPLKTLIASVGFCVLANPLFAADETKTLGAESVLARVDGRDILLGDVMVAWETLPPQYRNLPADTLLPALIDQLVRQIALAATEQKQDHPKITYSLRNQERALLANAAVERILDQEVSDVDLAIRYDKTFGSESQEDEFNASHILVESEEAALDIIAALNAGSDFAELAKGKSTGPSGPNGGNLGWFGKGMMVPEFEEAVISLTKGEISAPVQTQFGWHVVILNDIREKSLPSLEDVREELTDTIHQERVEAYVSALLKKRQVERHIPENIPTDLFQTQNIFE